MPKSLTRKIMEEGPLRTVEAARKWGYSKASVADWIRNGRRRESDGQFVKLDAIRSPSGYLTSDASKVRFFEKLNARVQ